MGISYIMSPRENRSGNLPYSGFRSALMVPIVSARLICRKRCRPASPVGSIPASRGLSFASEPTRPRIRVCFLMLPEESYVRLQMHSLGLLRDLLKHICSSIETLADSLCSAQGPDSVCTSLAVIDKLVAVATGKRALAIKNRYPASTATCRATEPCASPTVIARSPFDRNRNVIPLAYRLLASFQVVVRQNDPALCDFHRCDSQSPPVLLDA